MSIEERITLLEREKQACMEHFNAAITNLWNLKQTEEDLEPRAGVPTHNTDGFKPFRIQGKPLSQTILEDRGAY